MLIYSIGTNQNMATRSAIAIQEKNGSVKYIYCHYDGGRHVNETLTSHYTDRDKVEQLIALGDISSLDENITCPASHSFENQMPGYTVAYHRDRGEKLEINTCYSVSGFARKADSEFDYVYLFDLAGVWQVFCHR